MSRTGDWSETPVCMSSGLLLGRNAFWLLPSWVAIIRPVEDTELAGLPKFLMSVFLGTKLKKAAFLPTTHLAVFVCVHGKNVCELGLKKNTRSNSIA